ncbi:MAG: glycosyltransferase family 2 protein [Leptospira sp.]|nr:glycosyltransferase family 2 protein [Leptospira sp.]
MNYWVIIPALDEEESLPHTISKLLDLESSPKNIIVVDNGSSDNTFPIAKELGVIALQEPNRGYGNACLRGIDYIQNLNFKERPEYLVFMDADGSDDPLDIAKLLKPFQNSEKSKNSPRIESVIGSRVLGNPEKGSLGFVQKSGNWLSCFLLKIMLRARFTDLGPLRAIRTETLFALDMQDKNYGWTVEWQTKLALREIPYTEVAVNYKNRKLGKSKVSGSIKGSVLAGIKILSTIFTLYVKDRLPKMQRAPWIRFLFIAHLFAFTSLFVDKSQSLLLILIFFVGFVILLIPDKKPQDFKPGTFYLWTGILIRFPLIFILPLLSDDFYRTIWDAQVILQGFNPYSHTPSEIFTLIQTTPSEYMNSWIHLPYYEKLNSQNFHSFYPPLQHAFTVIAVLLGNLSFGNFSNLGPYKSMIGLKMIFFILEWANLYFLRRLLKNRTHNLKYYAWNPLIIMEGIGNLHFEIPLTTGLLLFFFLNKRNSYYSGLSLASSIWVKLTPILLLPFLIFKWIQRKTNPSRMAAVLIPSFVFIGIWLGLIWNNFATQWNHGIGLYSHSFEFFSSFNRLLRIALSYFNIAYSDTGLWVWVIFLFAYLLLILLLAKNKNSSLEKSFFLSLSLVFFFSPVIHPWYLIPWVSVGILLGYRSSIVGSFLILSSYTYYQTENYQRYDIVVWIAYILFFTFVAWELYEHKFNRNRSRSNSSSIRNIH